MKKMTTRFLLCMLLSLFVVLAMAQQKRISGTVKDDKGNPIAGATYHIKGTNISGATDENGHFSVDVSNENAVLEFTSVNFKAKEITVGSSTTLNVVMEQGTSNLSEVVVTALGIRKQKKSLGYSIQEVKGTSLVEARETNLVNDLSGKVAGLQVVRSGNGPGGSSQIVLRGNNSLTGISQPLIVVDGIPMDNSTGRVGIGAYDGFFNSTLDMGNGLSDINPDDIASVSVLKGPAAAALYGSLGGNGVILITTKSGKKQPGLGVTVSSSVGFESILT